ncbi:MAG: ParM/StbA family protein [Firmicutes bacterium]|nr:ParM/StbA family protein [Bacillota bacterium]
MEKNIGVDLGYGFVKITDGKKDKLFPSVVGQARTLRYVTDESPEQNLINNLHVAVEGREYFVGDLANRQSDVVLFSLNESRMDERISKILFATALALLAEGQSTNYNIVTGLPVGFYTETKQTLTQLYKGRQDVIMKRKQTPDQEYSLMVNEVKVLPEPFGSLFDLILDYSGNIVDENLAASKVGIIDVGFRTTDYIVVDNLENIDRLSGSSNTALSTAYVIISELLKEEFKITKPIYQLDQTIRSSEIRISGKTYNLDEIKKHAFGMVAEKLITEINSLWINKWELDMVFITGGGGMALAEYLMPHFENSLLAKEAQFANVYGFRKLAQRLFGNHNRTSSSLDSVVGGNE